MKKLLLIIFCSLCLGGIAQEEMLKSLNVKLGPDLRMVESRKGYAFEFIKNGEAFRTDQFYVEDIDVAKIRYDASEKQIWLECHEAAGDCFDRRIKRLKSRQPYPILYFSVSNAGTADEIIQLLRKLIGPEEDK